MKRIADALQLANKTINDIMFMLKTRTKPTFFTRGNAKMDFKNIIMFALNLIKKSIQIELDSFFKNILHNDLSITKQGYSQARQKVSPIAFVMLNQELIKWYYGDDDFKTYKGYRILAVDGSVLELTNTERLREAFGYTKNATVKLARALSSGIYDVENDMILASKITRNGTSERKVAIELIDQVRELGFKNDLIIFDRGYPSTNLIKHIEDNKIKYLIRVSSLTYAAVRNAKKDDQIIEFKADKEMLKMRVLRFLLDSGEEEVLITNLFDENLSVKDFKELYFKRWGIETKFNELKNKLQIENFTGDTPIAVEQDFYASIYLSNMAAIAKAEASYDLEQKNKGKVLKYEYKINTNVLIGKLKDCLVMALLQDNPRKRKKMVNATIRELQKNVVPIRPGRSNKRNMRLKANKYAKNSKRCL